MFATHTTVASSLLFIVIGKVNKLSLVGDNLIVNKIMRKYKVKNQHFYYFEIK